MGECAGQLCLGMAVVIPPADSILGGGAGYQLSCPQNPTPDPSPLGKGRGSRGIGEKSHPSGTGTITRGSPGCSHAKSSAKLIKLVKTAKCLWENL